MSLKSIATQFVELCNQGRNFDVMRTMYAPNIISVEGDGKDLTEHAPNLRKDSACPRSPKVRASHKSDWETQ